MKKTGLLDRLENKSLVQAVRSGLVMAIPILLIGSFALILRNFPIKIYLDFIETFADGAIATIFDAVHDTTFGMLSVYMTFTISYSYVGRYEKNVTASFGASVTALACFALLSGLSSSGFDKQSFGVKGMFVAILCSLIASVLYVNITKKTKVHFKMYADGIDTDFNDAISIIFPAFAVVMIFAIFDYAISSFFVVNTFYELFVKTVNSIFYRIDNSIFSGFLFVLSSTLMWFFGIHGSDVLENVSIDIFNPALLKNIELASAGREPTQIFCKTFFDVFVFVGGCGSALSLLLAIIVFSKHRSSRKLAKLAAIPMFFNINELMIFGLPVVFNPILLIPFLLTPLVSLFTTYSAMALGIVPKITNAVNWTTPILIGGYQATGSISASILQLVNLIIGVLIYRPFILKYDRTKTHHSTQRLNDLVETLKKSECDNTPITLTDLRTSGGGVARMLVGDLQYALVHNELEIFYQPQFDTHEHCSGVEALLRWKHPLFGMLYPPLIIKLAQESGTLLKLEEYIFEHVMSDAPELRKNLGENIKISVNATGETIQSPLFTEFLRKFTHADGFINDTVCIEITEQMALRFDNNLDNILIQLHQMGYLLAIDDFSMGATSIKYLQNCHFDLIKLDGSIVRDIEQNQRSKDIVSSIVYLSNSLDIKVLAEYVESKALRDELQSIGVTYFQGYLFGVAMPKSEICEFTKIKQ